ncbi:glycoside hydrolase family 76 protein [Whalleya microplaca]|nr:glycoside hydrolase family 76 protein [Whalleya microplaca]
MLTLLWGATCCLAVSALAEATHPPAQRKYSNGSDFPDVSQARAAISALNTYYDNATGRWDPNGDWWQSGISLQALADFMGKTGTRDYLAQAYNTVRQQRAPLAWWPEGGGEFRADSTDDTGWWALALTSLYELTGDEELLRIARLDEAYMFDYWNTTTCGGGLIWDVPSRTYHNAISNELYLQLTAKLHNLIPGDTYYLNHSLLEWDWFRASGMINAEGLINDGLTDDAACVNNGQPVWTYNQGVVLGGLVELWKGTGDTSYLDAARSIADAAIKSSALFPNGTLTDPCDTAEDCEPNGTAFKGLFMRELGKLNEVLEGRPYRDVILDNLRSMYAVDRNASDFYGLWWQGPFDSSSTGVGSQVSAVNLLITALGL